MSKLLTVAETLDKVNISRATLYRLIDEGLPYTTIGIKKKMFDLNQVEEFIAKRKSDIGAQLTVGAEFTNNELSAMFKCSTQGGMRRSNSSIALVLTSHHEDPSNPYSDYWIKDTFYYTGMGLQDDQDIDFAQNKTLAESDINGVVVYLFEVFSNHKYKYRGIVKLAGKPFQEDEKDSTGKMRKVWKFPLKLVNGNDLLDEKFITNEQEVIKNVVKRMSNEELKDKAKNSGGRAKSRNTTTTTYERNEFVREHSIRRANGICQLCHKPGPFEVEGVPYLESHHIVWLSRGGDDTVDNTSAVCPNCHKKLHMLQLQEDIEELKKTVLENDIL